MTSKEFNEYYSSLEQKVKSEQVDKLLKDCDPLHIITKYVVIKPKNMYMVIKTDSSGEIKAFETEMQAVDYCLDRYYEE